jgi:hypothetical protein
MAPAKEKTVSDMATVTPKGAFNISIVEFGE